MRSHYRWVSVALVVAAWTAPARSQTRWVEHPTGTKARLRGLSTPETGVVWTSGTAGTVARTADGGATWTASTVAGAEALDFRDVEALDARTAVLLASGPGPASRIYRTTDAGATWTLRLTNRDPAGFLDAIAFFADRRHGLALGDPVDGRFVIHRTDDGGATWDRSGPVGMPPALDGEGAFAASGTCLVALGGSDAWFATGGARAARVFRTTDAGATWTAHEAPIRAGAKTAGIFSVAFRDPNHGVAVGGDYQRPDDPDRSVALTADGGRTWSVPSARMPRGYRSAVAFGIPGPLFAAGPTGVDASGDEGRSWVPVGELGFHTLAIGPGGEVWASGDDGMVARLADPHP